MTPQAPPSSNREGPGPSKVELRTLGQTTLTARGRDDVLDEIVRQPKRFALLAYLAIATPRGPHRRDHLVGRLWPEMSPARARAALRRSLYFLRRRLGDGVLVGKGSDQIGIDGSALWCDAEALDRRLEAGDHEKALELYRGELLPGLGVDDAPGFDQWLDRRRRELRASATRAALALASRARAVADPAQEAELLERALEISPTGEPMLRDLMRARARAGDRTRGLETYRRWTNRHDGAGSPPSARTRKLAERLRAGDDIAANESETGPHAEPSAALLRADDEIRPGAAPSIVSPRRLAAHELSERARELAEGGPSKNLAAQELADEALRLEPESAAGYAARAETRAQAVQLYGADRGLLPGAVDDVHRALALAPHLAEAHFAHGLVLETAGRLGKAVKPFRRATELSEDDPQFSSHLGRVLMLRGGFAQSLDWTRRHVIGREPTPHHLLQIGLDHWCLGRDDEATALYRRAREEGGSMVWLDASWSYFELTRGRFDRAREIAGEMLAEHPDTFSGRFAAGDAALFARDFQTAIEHYEHCYRLDPQSRHTGTQRSIRLALGFARLEAGDRIEGRELVEAAVRDAERLTARGIDHGGVWLDLAAAKAVLGHEKQALAALARATAEGWQQPQFLRLDPLFDELRTDDRFEDMLRSVEEQIRTQREGLPKRVLDDCSGLAR